jgi:hypothetical protein
LVVGHVMLLPLFEALNLAPESVDLTSEVREDEFLGGDAEAVYVAVGGVSAYAVGH